MSDNNRHLGQRFKDSMMNAHQYVIVKEFIVYFLNYCKKI